MNLLLIRHTAVDVPPGLCYGRTDVPLAATFAAEAAAVRAALPPGPRRVVSSPSLRCRQLAMFLGEPVEIDARLQELDFGEWENRPWADLPRPATEAWLEDFVGCRPPGGESFAELATRAASCVDELGARYPGKCVVAVTHAGVIRALLARARGVPLTEAFSLPVPHGSVHAIRPATAFPTPLHA